ncbi:DUF1257 domain-containing protein [Sporosarcina sp. FSL K6-1508]|uniref:DUF1257 domain-containing protein n=1 Tax=Sporosarcina sp. FSL K6-1508 TaxID=2921553 RepID=UPI0030FB0C20
MSHFTSIKTSIKDIESLKVAAQSLGLIVVENQKARGYMGQKIKGDYVIKLKGPYDIALIKQASGTYEIVTDWWNGHVAKEVGPNGGQLLQNYGVVCAMKIAKERGLEVQHEKLKDGSIRIVATETVSVRG